jgi:hypothetical protein
MSEQMRGVGSGHWHVEYRNERQQPVSTAYATIRLARYVQHGIDGARVGSCTKQGCQIHTVSPDRLHKA